MLPVLSMMLLSGCGAGSHSDSCKLLPLVEYGPERTARIVEQAKVAGEDLQRFFVDAVQLRDAVRACRG